MNFLVKMRTIYGQNKTDLPKICRSERYSLMLLAAQLHHLKAENRGFVKDGSRKIPVAASRGLVHDAPKTGYALSLVIHQGKASRADNAAEAGGKRASLGRLIELIVRVHFKTNHWSAGGKVELSSPVAPWK